MDVAFGATDVPLPEKFVKAFVRRVGARLAVAAVALLGLTPAWAIVENQPIHFSADEQVWDRKTDQIDLFGNAAVTQPGETLTADVIHLDKTTRKLVAKGHCVYVSGETFIWGDRMDFDLKSRTGRIYAGRVSNSRFTLRGQVIDKLSAEHFKTVWGDYTTCRDCAASWSVVAEEVDLEFEGYAYFKNMTAQVKGAPWLWLPYGIMPLKTKRQSGVLTPVYSVSGDSGLKLVVPFFWAINESMDMTFGLGMYTKRGPRFAWEGRYALTPRSVGEIDLFYQNDSTVVTPNVLPSINVPHRWAITISQTQELGWGIEQKLKLAEVSDNIYPFTFPTDTGGTGEAFLPSTLSFSKNTDSLSAFVAFQRYRNLLNSTPGDLSSQVMGFDSKTVQVFPRAVVSANDYFLGDTGLAFGMSVGLDNFTRSGNGFDFDQASVPFGTAVPSVAPAFIPGQDPIRKATRFTAVPSIYATLRLADIVSIVPSAQYRGYFYNFGGLVPPLARGYLLFQTDITTQLEKIIDYPDTPDIPKVKHLIRPTLNYSLIPLITEDATHPFAQQITRGLNSGTPGYYFDNNDIIAYSYTPSSARFFLPLGHSLSYGLTSQWVRRRGAVADSTAKYETMVEWTSGQAVNFIEVFNPADPSNPHPLTRFYSNLNLNFDQFIASVNYNYYPDVSATTPRHTLSTQTTWIIERSMHQDVLEYDRSFSLGYNFDQVNNRVSNLTASLTYSISDYLMPNLTVSYDLLTRSLFGATTGLRIQSPSRCWWIFGGVGYRVETREVSYQMDFKLNMTGSGFNSMDQVGAVNPG